MRQIKQEKINNKKVAETIKKEKKFLLKDILFNKQKVQNLANQIEKSCKETFISNEKVFKKEDFVKDILKEFPFLELKERMYCMRDNLYKYLNQDMQIDYLEAIEIIKKSLPDELDNTKTDGDFGDFIYAPYAEYVSHFGLEKKHLKKSLNMLEEITKRFSSEYAIRHFWNEYEEETYLKFLSWSKSPYYHVRRLASEGSRPRLPWGKKINLHYTKTEKILDNLFYDKCRYVTRSVANHLNDISKIDKDFVIRKLNEWEKSNKQNEKEFEFIKKHATRTIRKKNL